MIRTINKAEQEGNNAPVRAFDTHTRQDTLPVTPYFVDGYTDAFGRQRIATQFTLADYSHVYGDGPSEMLLQKSGAQSDLLKNGLQAKASLVVGDGANDFVIYQSRKYHFYRPGKSQLVFTSFNFNNPREGTNKRIGYFDNNNGIYFQQSGDGSLQIVLRSNVSGSVQEEIIPQASWNKDTCDGNGKSQFNLNSAKTQLFVSDFQWLGVGRVRAGFVHNGEVIIAHEFYNSNNKDTVYWSNPSLPIRAEVRNYNSGIGTTSMDQICASVISEGGGEDVGVDFDIRTTGSRVVVANSSLPILAIKMKTGYNGFVNRAFNKIGQIETITEDSNIAWEIWRLPSGSSIIGGSWVSTNNESATEYNITATGFDLDGGYRYDAGFALAGGLGAGQYQGKASVDSPSESRQSYIAQNIEGTDSNVFTLLVYNLTSTNTDCFANMQWREVK
jgi:hypothetical protein